MSGSERRRMQRSKREPVEAVRNKHALTFDEYAALVLAVLAPSGPPSSRSGRWSRTLTWRPEHVQNDIAAATTSIWEGELRRDPRASSGAVEVVVNGAVIGYTEADDAAHLRASIVSVSTPIRVRRSRRKTTPLFEFDLPELHPAGLTPRACPVCRELAAKSREYRYGPLSHLD